MSANLVDDLLELLRSGKDVVYVDASLPQRRQLHRYLVARRPLGSLKGAMVDVVIFRGEPSARDHTTALAAVSVRRGRVDEVAA